MSSLRCAGPQDAAAIDAFLARFAATSMFLRSNLAHFGTCDEATPQGTTFFLADAGAAITAVFGLTNHGYLLAQAPEASAAQWAAFRDQIAGRTLVGMTGVPDQVQMCLRALDLADGPWQLFSDEPLYHLNIADLLSDPVPVRRATAADQPLLERWFAAYASDVGHTAPGAPPSEATKARLARLIDSPDLVLFEDDGTPVAMAAVNARLPDTVQIGGVFTPDGSAAMGTQGRLSRAFYSSVRRRV
ncbi:hypothetical protein [Tateyamaria sp.]|uniref:hypothetical protein n=1 Tax=Tateyamaria sp. TaxID=1929288 RepID=UPI003B21175A